MQIDTPLHAEHQLDQCAGQFAHWHHTRTPPGERFPHALRDHAVALAAWLWAPRSGSGTGTRTVTRAKRRRGGRR
jgi:hypothetical protein